MAHRVARRQFFRLEGGESEAGGRARAGFGYLENFFSLLALVFGFWFLVSVVLRRGGTTAARGSASGAGWVHSGAGWRRECARGRESLPSVGRAGWDDCRTAEGDLLQV